MGEEGRGERGEGRGERGERGERRGERREARASIHRINIHSRPRSCHRRAHLRNNSELC